MSEYPCYAKDYCQFQLSKHVFALLLYNCVKVSPDLSLTCILMWLCFSCKYLTVHIKLPNCIYSPIISDDSCLTVTVIIRNPGC